MTGMSQAVAEALSTKSTPFAAFTRAAPSEASSTRVSALPGGSLAAT